MAKAKLQKSDFVWRDDPDAEAILRYVGKSPTIKVIRLSEIDWPGSANNCARLLNPINEQKVEDYETGFRRGDVFPRIVVEHTKKGYVILGGNQRSNAVRRIDPNAAIEAYCVQSLILAEREAIIRSLNSRHGWGMDKAERIEHAVYLVRECGNSTKDAAWLMQVSDVTIHARIRSESAKAELAKMGIDSSRIPLGHLDAISKVRDESALKEIGETVVKFAPTHEQTKCVVAAVSKSRSQAERIKRIREWSNSLSESASITPKQSGLRKPRREKFFRHLQALSEFLERGNGGSGFSTFDELSCSEEIDGDKARILATRIIVRLKCITGVQ